MTEPEIAALLLESFGRQARLYDALHNLNLRCCALVRSGKSPRELLPLLQEKKQAVESIKTEEERIRSAKVQWQEGKENWADLQSKERVAGALSQLTAHAAEALESEKTLGEILAPRSGKPSAGAAAGKYGAQKKPGE
jgi:hypothetical protein